MMKKFLISGLSIILMSFSFLSYAELSSQDISNINASIEELLLRLRRQQITQEEALEELENLYNNEIVPNLDLFQNIDFDSLIPAILDTFTMVNDNFGGALNTLSSILTNPAPPSSSISTVSIDPSSLKERLRRRGAEMFERENMIIIAGWKLLAEEDREMVMAYAKKKKKKKIKKISPTVTGKLAEEDGQLLMNVYVWTGVGDPNNIHVDREFWNSLDSAGRKKIEECAAEYGGKVIFEERPMQIQLTLHITPVEGAPRDDHLTKDEVDFIRENIGEEITVHGWTEDGTIKNGYTLEVVGVGTWDYEPYHPFNTEIKDNDDNIEQEKKVEIKDKIANKVNAIEKRLISSNPEHEIFYFSSKILQCR